MIAYSIILLQLLKVAAVNGDQCYSWSCTDVFFIKDTSLADSAVLDRVESRSFVECCVGCDASQGCHGVAFREGECCLIDGTAAAGFVTSDGSRDDYKVMLYNTAADGQLKHNCAGSCKKCRQEPEADCKQLLDNGHTADGEYNIAAGPVYCDMTGGGWTVIQRRVDASVDFYRTYSEYVAGFGDPSGNFWAGLDVIHSVASGSTTELHVYLEAFDGATAWALYSSFSVGDAASGYLMTVSGYSGTAGDAMTYFTNNRFSTYDYDQDASSGHCAEQWKGAWWFKGCHVANPNGRYLNGAADNTGNVWQAFKSSTTLKTMEFKVRKP